MSADPAGPALYQDGIWVYKGVPVPWVARWSSEKLDPGPRFSSMPTGVDRGWKLAFANELPEDRIDDVLWLRENNSQGDGVPLWADVHSHRQRLAMLEGRCQICGRRTVPAQLRWIIPAMLHRKSKVGVITDQPPVCMDCRHLAYTFCPFIGSGTHTLIEYQVFGYRPHALFGDVFATRVGGQLIHTQADVPWDSSEIAHLMARQVVVELYDYRRVRE